MGKLLPIVKVFMDKKIPIGLRLKEERERLGENQTDFAALAGVTRKTLFGYESAERSPPAEALSIWAEHGLDVGYVVTGVRVNTASKPNLPADEQLLLDAYRGLSGLKRKGLLAELLTGGKKVSKKDNGVTISGSGHRVAGRDYNERKD